MNVDSKKKLLIASLVVVVILLLFLIVTSGLIVNNIIKSVKKNNESRFKPNPNPTLPPSSSHHLTNIKDWSFKSTSVTQIAVGFYNTKISCQNDGALVSFNCANLISKDGSVLSSKEAFLIKQAPAKLEVGQSTFLKFRIVPSEELVEDSYGCNFQVLCGGEVVEELPVFVSIID